MSEMTVESPTSLRKYELRYLYMCMIAVLLMGAFRSFFTGDNITISGTQLLIIHILLELFSVFVSISIFILAMMTSASRGSRDVNFFIGLVFLAVGLFDLLHVLLYIGMPFYTDEFTGNQVTWLWIFSRLTESIGIAIAVALPSLVVIWRRLHALLFTVLSVSIASAILFFRQDWLPLLLDNELEITATKISLEYIICLFMLVGFIASLIKYRNSRELETLQLCMAIFIIMIGELYFIFYDKVYDFENLVVHTYKFIGYMYLFRSLFYPKIQHILSDKEEAETKWREAEHMLFEAEENMSKLVLQAHEEERKRVSRELHDGIGQSLYTILMKLNMAEHEITGEEKPPSLQKARIMTAEAMKEVKDIAHSLRPSSLDDFGFLPALKNYTDRIEKVHNLQINLHTSGDKNRMDPEVETALYRICQEALINCAKYASSKSIEITLANTPDEIRLIIQDDGIGFSIEDYLKQGGAERKGIGLFSMKERAEACGGSFEVISEENVGTTVRIAIPK